MRPPTPDSEPTILIVDDTPANLGVLTHLLKSYGCRILVAQQGESGLQIARRAQPDLILLDVELPGMDGFTLCRRLKADPATAAIPVLFMTVRMEAADKLKGFATGAVDYITKPFEAAEVLARVTTHLRLQQLTRRLQAHNEELEHHVAERTAELLRANQDLQAQEAQLRAYTQRLQVLHTIDQAILAAQSPEAIAQAALERMRALVPCHWASVAVLDGDAQLIAVLSTQEGDCAAPVTPGYLVSAAPQIVEALRDGVVYVEDSEQQSCHPLILAPAPAAEVRSYISVPLVAAEELLGVLTISSRHPAAFAPDHIAIASEVANQIAVAIRQARLYAAEQRARQQAEHLRAANLALTQSLDLATILDTLLEHLRQLAPYDSASAMVLRDDTHLVVWSAQGAPRLGAVPLQRRAVLDTGAVPALQALLATQTSVRVSDTAGPPFFWRQGDGAPEPHSWLGVPLIAGGRAIGLYALAKHQPGFFTSEHQQLAESLAAQAAVAVQNARLYAEMSAARTRLQAVSRQLVAVQEAERARIARDLHDEIGQMLTGLKLTLAIGARSPAEMMRSRMDEAQALVNELTMRVRELSLDLRPAMLDDLGLLPALLWYIKRYTAQTSIKVNLRHSGLEQSPAPEVATAVYRLVQEGLTNVARHAGVGEVAVWLWHTEERIGVRIEDRGRGFLLDQVMAAHASSGLAGMAERVRLLGGHFTVESAPGEGARLTAELPLSAPPD